MTKPSTREVAEEIVEQVAVGCWQSQSPGHLTELIDRALQHREQEVRAEERERAAGIADACRDKWLEDARNVARADNLVGGLAQSTYTMYSEIANGIAKTIRSER